MQNTSAAVTIQTYDKAIYDHSQNNVWTEPTTKNLGAQNIPLTLECGDNPAMIRGAANGPRVLRNRVSRTAADGTDCGIAND